MILNNVHDAIKGLDLEPIKLKLMHGTFGEGWTQARADAIETEYRRFLYLQAAFPDEQTSPALDVDTFWHYHILDTMKYAADCEQTFGYFLHHYPYLGLLESDEEGCDIKAANRTRELYEATFGEPYSRAEAYSVPDMADQEGNAVAVAARCQQCGVARPKAVEGKRARCQAYASARPPESGAEDEHCQSSISATSTAHTATHARCQACIATRPVAAQCQACTAFRTGASLKTHELSRLHC